MKSLKGDEMKTADSVTRVLVVDDCAEATSTLAWILSRSGFHVAEANSADEALRQAERFEPDTVLLDLSLGDKISGLDVARELTRHGVKRPRIAAVTGWSSDGHRQQAAQAGCHAFFVKPVGIRELGAFIRGTCDGS